MTLYVKTEGPVGQNLHENGNFIINYWFFFIIFKHLMFLYFIES